MLEAVKVNGMWYLEFMNGHSGRYYKGDDDEPLTFSTKKAAETARRTIERDYSNIDRPASDFHAQRW